MSVSTATQLSAFLVKRPGNLAQLTRALAKRKINILALTLMDTTEQGVLRLVVDNITATREALAAINIPVTSSRVLLVEMANHPGAMAHVCGELADAHVSVSYAYCSTGAPGGRTLGVFKVDPIDKALKVLGATATPPKKDSRIASRGRGKTRR